MFHRCSVSEARTCFVVSLFNDAFLVAYVSCLMSKYFGFRKIYKWCVKKWSKPDPQVAVILMKIRRIVHYANGPGSSVGIATGYGLDGLEIESRRGRDFPHLFRPVLGPTQPPLQWVLGLSRG